MKLHLTIPAGAVALSLALAGCADSVYNGAPRPPAVLFLPGAGTPGPGTPRVHLLLDPPNSTLPEVELREVAGLELKSYGGGGPAASFHGMRLVPGSVGVCPVPCGAILEGRDGREFFFAGEGVRPSSRFALWNRSGDLVINVHPGSTSQWNVGRGLALAGGPLTLLGGLLLTGQSATGNTRRSAVVPAAILTSASAAMLGVGIILILTGRTTYSFHPAAPQRGLGR